MIQTSKDYLTDEDMDNLRGLALGIIADLDGGCDAQGNPCYTCRQDAVDRMIEYIGIHGYTVS